MSKRTTVRKIETPSVQGEGSFVILSSLKVSEIRAMRQSKDTDAFEGGVKMLAEHIVDWNWVNDKDEPMPVPNGNIKLIDDLTNEETELLSDLLVNADTKK